jgi:hypothetical protein
MTTAELVNLLIERLDSIERKASEFRAEMREDVREVKSLSRATNGRVTELERQKIAEHARLAERQRIDAEQAEVKQQRLKPLQQLSVGVVSGVSLTLIVAALNTFSII